MIDCGSTVMFFSFTVTNVLAAIMHSDVNDLDDFSVQFVKFFARVR